MMNPRLGQEPALAPLVEQLRAGELSLSDQPEKARADFEAMLAPLPVPEGIEFSETVVGGIPGLKAGYPGADASRVLLYFHGGAFVIGSAQAYRVLAANLARSAGMTGVAIDYRLAPEHRFPAAVEDCVAAYRGLLANGIEARNIVLAGDSAGGGLVMSTLIALRDAGEALPAAGVVLSPWVDLRLTSASIDANKASDPALDLAGLADCVALYADKGSASDPLASPVLGDLTGLPPLLIQVGSTEILLDDAIGLARAASMAGTSVRLDIWPNMPHVWQAFAFMLEAGQMALADAGAFMHDALGSTDRGEEG
jgi:acetyl esterase/lipase